MEACDVLQYLQEENRFDGAEFGETCRVRQLLSQWMLDENDTDTSILRKDESVKDRLINEKIISYNK